MTRILVIGGTNFIGPHVVRNLIDLGHEVAVFHRGQTESTLLNEVQHIRSRHGTIPVVEFPEAVTRLQPEVVVHMIPMGQADARAAVKFFSGMTQRIVGVSSGDVCGNQRNVSSNEPFNPVSLACVGVHDRRMKRQVTK